MCTDIAWSLQTSGQSAVLHEITAAGFYRPASDEKRQQVTLYLNPPEYADGIEEQLLSRTLRDRTGYESIALTVCNTEAELLSGLNRVTNAMSYRTERLVSYNGGDQTGGFALPFVRTRCAQQDVDWVFDDTPHLDLAGCLKTHFNLEQVTLTALSESALLDLAEFLGLSSDYRQTTVDPDRLRSRIRDAEPTDSELAEWVRTTDHDAPTRSQHALEEAHAAVCGADASVAFDPTQGRAASTVPPHPTEKSDDNVLRDLALQTLADMVRITNIATHVDEYVAPRYLDEVRL